MPEEPELETRVDALEARMDAVESEATAARRLAAYADRDIAALATKEQVAGLEARINARIDGLATQQQVDGLATQQQVAGLATREEVAGLATREEVTRLVAELESRMDARFDASTRVINALSEQTTERFAEMRVGFQTIISKLDSLSDSDD